MRYVILIMAATFFVLWEAIYSNWTVTNAITAEIGRLRALLGL